ncbi:MAG: hypothetical protein ABJA78_02045 [Ferruginibacter sp.]
MEYQDLNYRDCGFEQTEFSKSLLAGVLAGVLATCLSLIYNYFFRFYTGFSYSEIINVSTLIFALILVVTIMGIIYYFFHHHLKKGTIIYEITFLILTVLLFAGAMGVQRSIDSVVSKQFRELLFGVIAITGVCGIFVVPFLFKHDYV